MEDNYLEQMDALKNDCDRMGRDFVNQLKSRTGKQHDVTGIPIALAAVFDELMDYSQVDVGCFFLEETLKNFIGMRLERYAPGIEALYTRLNEIGAIGEDRKCNNGGDYYVYCLPSTHEWRYAIACETQNRKFLVLMKYGSNAKDSLEALKEKFKKLEPSISESEIERVLADSYRPRIYIIQYPWDKPKRYLERHSELGCYDLPKWMDDLTPWGYVAFLKDGQVDGAISHYDKIRYCLYTLASFIECKDELEIG
jgi:hypothetical protein